MNIASITNLSHNLPIDWLVIAIVALAVAIDAVRSSPSKATAFALALPAAYALFLAVPHAFGLEPVTKQFSDPRAGAIEFLMLLIAMWILIRRMIGTTFDTSGSIVNAGIVGLATAVIFMCLWVSVPAFQALWHPGTQVQTVFGASYRLWWLGAAYVALAFGRG